MPEQPPSPEDVFHAYLAAQAAQPDDRPLSAAEQAFRIEESGGPLIVALGALLVAREAAGALPAPHATDPAWVQKQKDTLTSAANFLRTHWWVWVDEVEKVVAVADSLVAVQGGGSVDVVKTRMPLSARYGVNVFIEAGAELGEEWGEWLTFDKRNELVRKLYGNHGRPVDIETSLITPLAQIGVIEIDKRGRPADIRQEFAYRLVGLEAREQAPRLHDPCIPPRVYISRVEALVLAAQLKRLRQEFAADESNLPMLDAEAAEGLANDEAARLVVVPEDVDPLQVCVDVAHKVGLLRAKPLLLWALSRSFTLGDPRQPLLQYIQKLPTNPRAMRRWKEYVSSPSVDSTRAMLEAAAEMRQ